MELNSVCIHCMLQVKFVSRLKFFNLGWFSGVTGHWGSTKVKSKLTWSQISPVNTRMYKTYWLETYFIILKTNLKYGNNHCFMGRKDGVVVRALASHQYGPGSNLSVNAICGSSLLLVLSFAPRGFSLSTPVFRSPQKPMLPNSNSTRNHADEEPLCGCPTSKSLFIYLFIYLL